MMVKALNRLTAIMLLAALAFGIYLLPGCSVKVEQLDDNNDAVNGQTDDTEVDADETEPSQLLNFRSSANTEALSRFGFTLLQSMAKESDDSILISPLSVSVCLAMIANGAEGESRDLLLSSISGTQSTEESNAVYGEMLSAYDELGGSTDYSLANCACVDPFGIISESFIETCESTFDAEVIDMPLSTEDAMKTINQRVSKKTDGKIDTHISEARFGCDRHSFSDQECPLIHLVNAAIFSRITLSYSR